MEKCLNCLTCLSKEVYCDSNVSPTGVWGRTPTAGGYGGLGEIPTADGRLFVIFWIKKLFYYHWITFYTYSETFESTRFLTFEIQLKAKLLSSFFCSQFKSKTCLKSCILGLNFVSDLAQVGGSKVHCLLHYFSGE